MPKNTQKHIGNGLEGSFFLGDEAIARLGASVPAGTDAATVRGILRGIEETEVNALLEFAIAHAVETKNAGMLERLDRWVRGAKKALNATDDDVTHSSADAALDSALEQL